MRKSFAENFIKLAQKDKKIIFLTGDLGFNAFEQLKKTMKNRFINAGVAEHNMASVAAGLAAAGYKPWIYSIAPFVTIKILEELRNDICIHNRNVKIVGIGGGFDYGLAGPTHHILQDVNLMLSLPNMTVMAPGFIDDVGSVIKQANRLRSPVYIRLTKGQEINFKEPLFKPIRRLINGNKKTVVVFGSIIIETLQAILKLKGMKDDFDVWLVCQFPIKMPPELIRSIRNTSNLTVVEEHQSSGGLGNILKDIIIEDKISIKYFHHLCIKGYKSHKYGSRQFHLKENKLDERNIYLLLKKYY